MSKRSDLSWIIANYFFYYLRKDGLLQFTFLSRVRSNPRASDLPAAGKFTVHPKPA